MDSKNRKYTGGKIPLMIATRNVKYLALALMYGTDIKKLYNIQKSMEDNFNKQEDSTWVSGVEDSVFVKM